MSTEIITLLVIIVIALFGTLYILNYKIDKCKEEILNKIDKLTEQNQNHDKPE